jgi:hypothetical protein
VAAVVAIIVFAIPKPPPALISVTIRTDPDGVTVKLGDRTCVTPSCDLKLKPGQYTAEAQRDGYEPASRTFTVVSGKAADPVAITLKPIPPPPPPPGVKKGTLLIHVELPDVRVSVDGHISGRTDPKGNFSLQLEAKSHEVRVEKDHYEPVPGKQVTIDENSETPVAFSLVPKSAHLQLLGAPSNVDIRMDGAVARRTDGSSPFLLPVKPGQHKLQIQSWERSHKFDPEETLTLEWKEIAPPPVITKQPPEPSPEEQAWNQAKDTTDPDRMKNFLDHYPSGLHASTGRDIWERLSWDRTKKDSIESLENYRRTFPNGAHVKEAEDSIARLKPPAGNTKPPIVEPPKPEPPKHPTVETTVAPELDAQFHSLIERFNQAQANGSKKDIRSVWPKADGPLYQRAGGLKAEVTNLRVNSVSENTAIYHCLLTTTTLTPRHQEQQKFIVLFSRRGGSDWVIESFRKE